MNQSLLQKTLDLIDAANSKDPNQDVDAQGDAQPKEWLYSQRMTQTLTAFAPNASEHLQLAARAQHIERWTSQRSHYPEGRAGYKKWRAELGLFHAKRAGQLMGEAGYHTDSIQRVRYIVQKRGLKKDTETQCLEDVICLVFMEHYLPAFALKHDEAKLLDIIKKTWAKMSATGQRAALELPLTEPLKALVTKALATKALPAKP